MTDTETAWLAGLLEGEGSFTHWPMRQGKENVVRISMATSDLDVLQRVARVTGIGDAKPIKPQHNKLGTNPMWHWDVTRKSEVRDLASRLLPWLGERRGAAARSLVAATADIVIRAEGICANGHRIEGENAQSTGRSFACRTCVRERRQRQARDRRDQSSNQTL